MFKVWASENKKSPELSERERSTRIKQLRCLIENGELKGQIETKDIILISSLHARDWDVDAAYKRLRKYLKFRVDYPDWVIDEHPKAYEQLLFKNVTTMFDGRDKDGRRVYLINVRKFGPGTDVSFAHLHQIHNTWFEMIIYEPETIVNGVSIILDFTDVGWSFIKWFSTNMAVMSSKMVGMAPLRNIFIHIVNTTPATVTLVKILLPFLGERVRQKFHIHYNYKSLHEFLGTAVLPVEFGGSESKILDYDKLRENLYHAFNKHPKKNLRKMKCEPETIMRPIRYDRLR